jgi:hypothetical protein
MLIDGASFALGFAMAALVFGTAVGVFVVTVRWMSRRAIILLDEDVKDEPAAPLQPNPVQRGSLYNRN